MAALYRCKPDSQTGRESGIDASFDFEHAELSIVSGDANVGRQH